MRIGSARATTASATRQRGPVSFVMRCHIPVLALVGALGLSFNVPALELQGFTEPFESIDIAAAEPGVIATVNVKEGEAVKAGQLLAELDNRVLDARVALAKSRMGSKGAIQAAAARVELRKVRLQQLTQLAAGGNARANEVAQARMERQVALAELQKAREEAAIARLHYKQVVAQREQRRLRSPVDGRVIAVHKDPAELVGGSDAKVVTVAVLDPLRVVLFVPYTTARALSPAEEITVRFEGHVIKPAKATVELISPVIDAESGTTRLKLLVPNPTSTIPSGLRVIVNLP